MSFARFFIVLAVLAVSANGQSLCEWATGCASDIDCATGLLCYSYSWGSQCKVDPQYATLTGCSQMYRSCSVASDCCNPGATCATDGICRMSTECVQELVPVSTPVAAPAAAPTGAIPPALLPAIPPALVPVITPANAPQLLPVLIPFGLPTTTAAPTTPNPYWSEVSFPHNDVGGAGSFSGRLATWYYVPLEGLVASQYDSSASDPNPIFINDQTLWQISRFKDNYFYGQVCVATWPLGGPLEDYPGSAVACSLNLAGTVTPRGAIQLDFDAFSLGPLGLMTDLFGAVTGTGILFTEGDSDEIIFEMSMNGALGVDGFERINHYALMRPTPDVNFILPGTNMSIADFAAAGGLSTAAGTFQHSSQYEGSVLNWSGEAFPAPTRRLASKKAAAAVA